MDAEQTTVDVSDLPETARRVVERVAESLRKQSKSSPASKGGTEFNTRPRLSRDVRREDIYADRDE